ncbi:hypothetical protein Cni_G01253 [Canna indica]|uniref:Uncharacterized protein n=1 Tax=Canna indica TaxID=4628 RepID=A0AAQ3JMX7_9LILI|nr:hypothetical protein Cni_G01253 [Canna indica]
MPSGAKKRKAAKRKQQMAVAPAEPPPPPPPQGNGHHDDLMPRREAKDCDGGSTTSSSSPSSSPREKCCSRSDVELLGHGSLVIDSTTESDKGAALAQDEESAVVVEEVVFAATAESFPQSEDSSIEFVKSEKRHDKSVEEVIVEKIDSFPLEGSEGDDTAAGFTEEAIKTSDEVQVQVVSLPDVDKSIKQPAENREDLCVTGKAESALIAEVAPPSAPLIVHRTRWWSCCGLLDFFTDSGR